MDRNQIF